MNTKATINPTAQAEQIGIAPELAKRAEDLGIRAVTVHGRTRQQFYTGNADWDAVGAVKTD